MNPAERERHRPAAKWYMPMPASTWAVPMTSFNDRKKSPRTRSTSPTR